MSQIQKVIAKKQVIVIIKLASTITQTFTITDEKCIQMNYNLSESIGGVQKDKAYIMRAC